MFVTMTPSTLFCVGVLLLTIYLWLKSNYSYWHSRGIPYIHPSPFVGNLKDLLRFHISFGDFFRQLYNHPASNNQPLVGFYVLTSPALLVRDPELVNRVLIKDFYMFLNRYEAADPHYDVMGSLSLPLAKYPIWRESRKRMSTFFTSGKMKNYMYPRMLQIAEELEMHIERWFNKEGTTDQSVVIEVKEMCTLFTTDMTARLIYGLDTKCLRASDAPLIKQWQELIKPNVIKALHFFIIFFMPHLTTLFRAKVFTRKYSAFMRKIVNEINMKRRRDTSAEGNFIELLWKFKEEYTHSEHFTNSPDFVASQAAIFLLAGFETSSSLIAFTLYELAKQPKIQHHLREEIKLSQKTAIGASISYECINELSYLGKVVAEALRLYPAASFINRECTPITGSRGCSLKPFYDYEIPAGIPAYISILGLHRDAKYWPNPLHFDPERFSEENIKLQKPMTYIPFGMGPHSCIGSRLGILQVKLGLFYILRSFYVETCSSTVREIKFDPKAFMLQSLGGIYLKFVRG